jgi:hypothetical protein
MKVCKDCEVKKPLTDFYRHTGMADGHLNTCKECKKTASTLNRNANIERYRQYDRDRSKDPERIATARELAENWKRKHKKEHLAQLAVQRAVRVGVLTRLPCMVCGEKKTVAHHEDYDKRLDVLWLCEPCHKERHKQMRIENAHAF